MSLPRRILFSTITNAAGKVLRLAIAFLLTPFVLHRLGQEEYGLWMLLASMVGYAALLDFGIASAVVRYVAQYRATGTLTALRPLLSTAFILYAALGAVAMLAVSATSPFFSDWFQVSPSQASRVPGLVLVTALGVGLAIPCSVAPSVLAGLHRFDLLNVLGVASALLSGLVTVVLLMMGGGLFELLLAGGLVPVLMQVPYVLTIHRIAPDLRIGLRDASRSSMSTVIGYSSSTFISDLAGCLLTRTDEIVIAAFLPVSAVSPFSLARKLGEVPQTVADQFLRVMLPISSDLDARGDLRRLRMLFLSSTRVTLAVSLAITCPLLILSSQALTVWVGAQYAVYGPLLIILATGSTIDVAQWPATFLLQGMGKHRMLAFMSLGIAIFSVLLSVVLAPVLGLTGVALGTLIPTVLGSFLLTLPFTLRTLEISGKEVFLSAYSMPVLAAGVAFTFGYILALIAKPGSLVSVAAIGSAMVGIYIAVYAIAAAREPECLLCRQYVTSGLYSLRRHLSG